MVSKEYWASLSDEDKSKIIRKFCEINDLGPDFDYSKVRAFFEEVKQKYKEAGLHRGNQAWEHPILVLELVDPLMAEMVLSWMYAKVELPSGERSTVPFMGYHIVELVFDKGSLMKFTDEEKNVLNHAMDILKSKGV
nr:MAG TPA: hypothetical protein [Caudoviricetes sp.]